MLPVTLTIAGSDSCSGAGIQADLKTFSTHRTHGLTVVTCVVAEDPHHVRSIHPIPADVVASQLDCLLDTYPVAAIKTGMLFSSEIIQTVHQKLQNHPQIPLVVDPVMVATAGDKLLQDDAIQAYRDLLLPRATLITPNMPEASVLLGRSITKPEQLEEAAVELSQQYRISTLLKGGHLVHPETADNQNTHKITDILVHRDQVHIHSAEKIDLPSTHGTGCTLSAAITAQLAQGHDLPDAVTLGIAWIRQAIAQSFAWTHPKHQHTYCLNHLDKLETT